MECHECGNDYQKVAQHWAMSGCDYPSLTDRQSEILTGLLMGDGCVARNGGNPYMVANMITKPFLEWLDQEMGSISNGVRLYRTADELSEINKSNDMFTTINKEKYNDQYRWQSKCIPDMIEFYEWYETGKKVWPSVDLSPMVLKVLYCCDGTIKDKNRGRGCISIGMSNEKNNKEKVNKMFKDLNVSGRWNEYEYESGEINCTYTINTEDSQKLFDIMGDPLPGFEYKWPGDI